MVTSRLHLVPIIMVLLKLCPTWEQPLGEPE